MAVELTSLLIVNAAYLAVGAAFFVVLGWVTRDRGTWYRLGAAFPIGVIVLVVPASYVALAGIPVSLTASVVGALILAGAAVRARVWRGLGVRLVPRRPTVSAEGVAGALLGLVLAALLLYSARTFATRPFVEWDSWVVWMSKARLLYEAPSAAPEALRSGHYGQSPYPLGLPTIEALAFSAMGKFDGTLLGVQFLLLAASFPVALWALLRDHARTWMIALVSLVAMGAPQLLFQLLTRYADVPLGIFVGLGLAAGASWILSARDERWLLGCFALFLGMAGITKNEGLLFSVAGGVALLVATLSQRDRSRLRDAALAVGAMLAVILPWRVYCSVHGLSTPDYDLARLADPTYLRAHSDRLWPAATELWHQATIVHSWGLLPWVILLALLAGVLAARGRVVAFALLWLVLAAGGLLATYWVSTLPLDSNLTNTSFRTIVSMLIGGVAVVPLLLFPRRVES
ncbi:MAG TPA: hypothetical protein VGO39_11520 [Gaiellaceae bacterium]|nr:hypothetical protein [Gaiellaceae bacterium]